MVPVRGNYLETSPFRYQFEENNTFLSKKTESRPDNISTAELDKTFQS